MAENDLLTLGKIHYYMRGKYYGHAQTEALEGLRKYGNDPLLKFYVGANKILEGRTQEGISDLEMIKDKRDVNVCTLLALSHGHRLCKTVDKEAVQAIDTRIKEERKQAGELGLLFAGRYLMMIDKCEKAKEYLDRAIKLNNNKQALIARAWLELELNQDQGVKKAAKLLEDAETETQDPDLYFTKARLLEMKRNFSGSLDLINQTIVTFQHFLPALIEKMRIQLLLQDWDQVMDTVNRALMIDDNCIEAKKYSILYSLVRRSSYDEASTEIGELIATIDRVESRNAFLYAGTSATFARVCGKNQLVLQQCYEMIERAVSLEKKAEYFNELGYQLFLKDEIKRSETTCHKALRLNNSLILDSITDDDLNASLTTYSKASKYSDASAGSMCGVIRAQLLLGNVEEARSSLEFLNELSSTMGHSAEVSYLTGIMERQKNAPAETVIEKFQEAITVHFTALKGVPVGFTYFTNLNPELLLRMITDLLEYAPQHPSTESGPPNKILKISSSCLESVVRVAPGLLEACYLLAKIKYLLGDNSSAQNNLKMCIDQDSSYANAHILMAQIHLSQDNFKLANQSLEMGLSYNFEVREHPLYHLIKSRILKKQGDIEEAKKTLQGAMSLPGVKTVGKKSGRGKATQISVNDRVSVFLELADAHLALGEQPEAAKIMQDAVMEFQGTPEELRINIANADLAINRGDIDGALTMLRNIGPEQAYFVEAREKMAKIYLHHRKDPRLYAGCYRELAEKNPTPQTEMLLGDAYMAIQETDKAIEIYERALKKNPKDGALASKIGEALVRTHRYNKAITYYEHSIKGGGPSSLKYDLASLLLKLRSYDKCEKVLKIAIDMDRESNEFEAMADRTKYLLLLAKVYTTCSRPEESLEALNNAKDNQARVLSRAQMEAPDTLKDQRALAATICSELAQQAEDTRDYEKAIRLYKEAAGLDDTDGKYGLKLANLLLLTEDLDACQHHLLILLKHSRDNEAATVMMADLMFRKNEYDQAMTYFQQLLERRPDHWHALSRLIDLMRRAGQLEQAEQFLKKAETQNTNAQMHAGYNYCKGLHHWYSGDPNSAIKCFNMARKDSEFGPQATYALIEICLNPDNVTIGGEVFENISSEGSESETERNVLAVKTAEKLLRDLRPKGTEVRPKLLENMMSLQTKNKANVEQALQSFMEIATEYRDHVGALYGMAAAYMILKQQPRARNQLKRLQKAPWNIDDAEDLEKAWLLLADIYIQSNKYDLAVEMLKKVLAFNKSCCKAYEYMGFIMEKEQSFKAAAENYELAWKFGNKHNPQIGYKLSFNYLKAKRYVDAIDIAQYVLKAHPNYPKIRKDILDKARISIRT